MKTVNKPELLCFGPDTLCKVEPTSLILNSGINFFESISWCWSEMEISGMNSGTREWIFANIAE